MNEEFTDLLLKVVALITVIGIIFLVPWVFQVCWNLTMIYLFGLPEITYWQSFALIFIVSVLFGKIKK